METLEKGLTFSQKKASFMFSKMETAKKFFIYQETETLKSFLDFRI